MLELGSEDLSHGRQSARVEAPFQMSRGALHGEIQIFFPRDFASNQSSPITLTRRYDPRAPTGRIHLEFGIDMQQLVRLLPHAGRVARARHTKKATGVKIRRE